MLAETGLSKSDPNLIEELYNHYRYKKKPRQSASKTAKKNEDIDMDDMDDDDETEDEDADVTTRKPELQLVITNTGSARVVKSTPAKSTMATTKAKAKSTIAAPTSRIARTTIETSSNEPRSRPRRSATKGVRYNVDTTSSDDDTTSGGHQSFFAREHSPLHSWESIKTEDVDDTQHTQADVIDTLPAPAFPVPSASSYDLLPSWNHAGEPQQHFMADYPMASTEVAQPIPQYDHAFAQMMAPEPVPTWGYGYHSSPETPQTASDAYSTPTFAHHYGGSFSGLGIDMSGLGNHYGTHQNGDEVAIDPVYLNMNMPLAMWYN